MATTYQYSVSGSLYDLEFNITPNSGPLGSNSKLTIEGKVSYGRGVQGYNLYLEFRPMPSSDTVSIGSVFRFRTWSPSDTSTKKVNTFTQTITISQSKINAVFALVSDASTSATTRVRFSVEGRYPSTYASDLSYTLYKQRVNPTLSNPALTDRHPAISGTDTPYEFFGGFVQGESLPRFETDFTLDSHFPALTAKHTLAITQNSVEVLTLTQTTAAGVTHVAFDLDAFTETGQMTISYTLTDSAGKTATLVAQFTVYAYSPPSVTSFLLERYRTIPGGTELADDGEYAWLTLAGEVASVNSLNACSVTLVYSHDGGTETTVPVTSGTDGVVISIAEDSTTQIADTVLYGKTFDAQYTYDFVLTVTDMLHTVTMTGSIYKAGGFFCVEKNGVAVGMRAKNDPNDKRFDVHPDYTSHFGGMTFFEGGVGTNSLFKIQTVEHSFSLSGAGRYPSDGNLEKFVDCGVGWTPVYVIGYNTNNSYCYPFVLYIDSDPTSETYKKLIARFRYTYTATTGTMDITINVLCMHTSEVIADTPADYPPIDIVKEYEEGEVLTGATWIDDKPVYRYIYHNSAFNTGTGTSNIELFTVPSDMESIVNLYGSVITTTTHAMYPLNYYLADNNSQYVGARTYNHATEPNRVIMRHSYTTARTYDLTVIVEYTKHTT